MEKTKLGMSVGLLGAVMFFSGLASSIVLFLLAGYVLLMEENQWLRKAAVKAMVFIAVFAVAGGLISSADYVVDIINRLISLIPGVNFRLPLLPDLLYIIRIAVSCLEKIALVLLGVRALSMGSFPIGPVDSMVEKHTAK